MSEDIMSGDILTEDILSEDILTRDILTCCPYYNVLVGPSHASLRVTNADRFSENPRGSATSKPHQIIMFLPMGRALARMASHTARPILPDIDFLMSRLAVIFLIVI